MAEWPQDADGDVLRRLKDAGLDFATPHTLDFNVDFDSWPPKPEAVALLTAWFPSARLIEPDGGDPGYALFQIFEKLSYEFVVGVQAKVSRAMRPFGGVCESWGILQE